MNLNQIGTNAGSVIGLVVALLHYGSIAAGLFAVFRGVYMWYSSRNGRGGDEHKHAWYWLIGGIAISGVGVILSSGSMSLFGTTDANISGQWGQSIP